MGRRRFRDEGHKDRFGTIVSVRLEFSARWWLSLWDCLGLQHQDPDLDKNLLLYPSTAIGSHLSHSSRFWGYSFPRVDHLGIAFHLSQHPSSRFNITCSRTYTEQGT